MLRIYTIRDKKMDTHSRPMYVPHLVEIQRSLVQLLGQKDSQAPMALFPTDYELYFLGEWEEKMAEYKLLPKPEFVMNVSDLQEDSNVKA